jgi:hypothetical protein
LDRPLIEGSKVTLTCTIQGGNHVATITWSCEGATHIIPTGSPSTVDAISIVEHVTSKTTMDKYVHVQEDICYGQMTKHNNTTLLYIVNIK